MTTLKTRMSSAILTTFIDRRTPEQVQQDARFAAMVGGQDVQPGGRRRGIASALWERIRTTLSRNPGVLPAEAVQAHTDAARAAEAAKIARLRSTSPELRVQDRHDASTTIRSTVGARGAASRKLNTHNMPRPWQPPVWAIDDEDYDAAVRIRPGETVDSSFFRGNSRPQGQQSRHQDARWDLGAGEHFTY